MEFEKLEKMAFKNKIELSKLDKQDLLAIIEFLQLDRKSWFDQFTKTHNESIAIAKQNQKRKEVIDKAIEYINEYAWQEDIIGDMYTTTGKPIVDKYMQLEWDNCNELLDILKEVE